MKELKIQSIVDMITNSSSEIFIIKDETDTEMTLENYNGFLKDLESYTNLFLEKEHMSGSYSSFDSAEDCYEASIAERKHFDPFYEYGYDIGDLLIESQSDNTIPWEVMDYIEESARNHGYQCKRRHLG